MKKKEMAEYIKNLESENVELNEALQGRNGVIAKKKNLDMKTKWVNETIESKLIDLDTYEKYGVFLTHYGHYSGIVISIHDIPDVDEVSEFTESGVTFRVELSQDKRKLVSDIVVSVIDTLTY